MTRKEDKEAILLLKMLIYNDVEPAHVKLKKLILCTFPNGVMKNYQKSHVETKAACTGVVISV
jgi:hypothetical protein